MSTPWSEIMSVVQTPVSMRMPSSTSRMPPVMLMTRMWRRRNVTAVVAQPRPSASSTNGMPSPSEYVRPRIAARPGSPKFQDSAVIAARVGPMHGAQPRPSARPSRGAPMRPILPRTCGLIVRCAKPNSPMKTRPSRMMTPPRMRVMRSPYRRKNWPSAPPRIVIAMNTTVNPAMNSETPPRRRARLGTAIPWSLRVEVTEPPMNPR